MLFAAPWVRLWRRKFREADVVFMQAENAHRHHDRFWAGADLVMEVVSPGQKARERDLKTKREEYARAGIPEYWVVDPQKQRTLVLALSGDPYRVHGEFGPGMAPSSALLPDLRVPVSEVFAATSA